MVGSGLVLWTVKRRGRLPDPARPPFGFRLVERLNIAVIAGLPAGIAIYFLANPLLPLEKVDRAEWEVHSLFIVWGAMLARAMVRPARRAWLEGLAAAATLDRKSGVWGQGGSVRLSLGGRTIIKKK